MNSKFIRKGIVLAALTCAMLVPSTEALAAGRKESFHLPKRGFQSVIDVKYLVNATAKIEKYVEEAKGEYYDMAFAVAEGSYLYVKSAATEESDWVGKIYHDGAAHVISEIGDWIEIESGNVTGYVKKENMITCKQADIKAKEILAAMNPGVDITALDEETVKNSFTYAETKEEEAARLEAEDMAKRQAVVDFAVQFVGNPYRWGGTSLTNGADCSGFVQSVYANFGVGMPRTSRAMRNSGVEVSYSDAKPGDVICYQGHVGIYAGNGQIVNAIDDAHGIGMSSATYANIITVRRIL